MSVYFYGCVTLDGYLADKNHGLNWLYETGSPEITTAAKFYKKMDITIMGRRTFNEVKESLTEKNVYPTTENYVFTHEENFSYPYFTSVSEEIVSFVKKIPQDKNVWIVGGNQLVAPLLNADLFDVFILQFAPVLLGKGVPLFTQEEGLKRFKLQEVHQYGPFAELVLIK